MEELWHRISSWFAQNYISYRPYPAGVSDRRLGEATRQLQSGIPIDMAQSYMIYDGTNQQAIFENQYLLSIDEIVAASALMRSGFDEGWFEDFPCEPQGPIKPVKWNKNWIPITDDGAGDHVCVDMDPARGGTIGQIIATNHEIGPLRVLAKGFRQFLTQFADDLDKYEPLFGCIVRIDGVWLFHHGM
jgi:cell wall assembly regulator SMI1